MSRIRSRRRLGVVLVAALVVLAGCSGAGGGGAGGGDAGASASVDRGSTVAGGGPENDADGGDGGAGGGSDDAAFQVQQRQVIMTGDVTLRVENFDRSRRNLTAAARDMDGFVSDSTRRRHEVRGGAYVTGSVTLRVPQERFDTMMDRAESTGTLQSSNVRSEDVTEQLVDIEARLSNLRAERERLRTLYEQANDTEAVLAVQGRLSDVQGQIERLEARQRALERQVAYSTVRVELREERPEPGPDELEQWYDVPLVGAFLESVNGVVVVARAAAVLAAYALPYLLAFAGPPVLVGALAYRRWRGSDDDAGDAAPPDVPDGGGGPPDDGNENGIEDLDGDDR